MINLRVFKTKKERTCLKLSKELLEPDDYEDLISLFNKKIISFSYEYLNIDFLDTNFYPQIYTLKQYSPQKIVYLNSELKKNFLRKSFKQFSKKDPEKIILNIFAQEIKGLEPVKKTLILLSLSKINIAIFSDRENKNKYLFSKALRQIYPTIISRPTDLFGLEFNNNELKKGVLAKANDGLLVIEDFDKLDKKDLEQLNQALQNKVIFIKKGKKRASEDTDFKLLAIANSKEARFVSFKPEITREQISLSEEELKLFNIIFVLRDIEIQEIKKEESKILIETDFSKDNFSLNKKIKKISSKLKDKLDYIKEYLIYAESLNSNIKPQLKELIAEFVVRLGNYDEKKHLFKFNKKNIVKTIIELAKANAKLNLRTIVKEEDIEEAKKIIGYSLIVH